MRSRKRPPLPPQTDAALNRLLAAIGNSVLRQMRDEVASARPKQKRQ